MVRGVLAACEESEEGVGGGRVGGCRIQPLLGDGDAIFEKAEGLRAPEGGEVFLYVFSTVELNSNVGERGVVEQQVLEVAEVEEGGGDGAGERVVAEIEYCEICESSNRWGYGAT